MKLTENLPTRNGAAGAPPPRASSPAPDDPRVTHALEDYLAACEAGARPDRGAFLARYPEIADVLAGCLDGLDFIHAAAPEASRAEGAAPAGEDLPVTRALGDFRILREVGRGGMGIVYEAEQLSLSRRVALKVLPLAGTLDARQLRRFQNEARAAAGLHHTNIVPVYYVGSDRGVHYYAMQFIEGRDLARVLANLRARGRRQTGPSQGAKTTDSSRSAAVAPPASAAADTAPVAALSTQRSRRSLKYFQSVARLGIQAAEALDHAHQQGIVHRDIKPANLLVDADLRLWVTDFGLAHIQSDARLTITGDLVGTLRYMSPEQALAKRVVVDHRTDIYSLGATLYELLTLEPVFPGVDRQELLRQIAFDEARPPRRHAKAIPAELETIVLKALEKNPAHRYDTAQELADDLERFVKDEPIHARRPALTRRLRRWCQRHKATVTGASVMVLSLLLLGGIALWQRAATAQAVADDLKEADIFRSQEQWARASHALERASGRLAGSGLTTLQADVGERRREVRVVDQLEKARLQAVGVSWRGDRDYMATFRAYSEAFAEYRLQVAGYKFDAEATARQIQDSPIRMHLVRALDHWAVCKDHLPGEGGERLRRLAQAADNDPWRAKLRDPQLRKDRAALLLLAGQAEALAQPPENLLHLFTLLQDAGAPEAALALLLKVQPLHPADFWINYQLAYSLGDDRTRAAEAVAFGRAALALRPDSPVVYLNLANALGHQGMEKEPEAEALTRKAIALKGDYGVAYLHLANNQLKQHKLPEAEAAFRKAVQLQPDWGMYSNFAEFLSNQGRRSEAASIFRMAVGVAQDEVEKTKAKLGPDHADTLRSMHYLAAAYYHAGRLEEAIALLELALDKQKAKLGPDHRDTLTSMNNLAMAYQHAGRLEEAIALLEQTLEKRKAKLGPDHRDTLTSMNNLAMAYQHAGRLEEAIALHEQTLEKCKAKLGPDHPDTLTSMSNLEVAYWEAGRLQEATALGEQTLEKRKAKLGPDHRDTLTSMNYLAVDYRDAGRLEEAIALLEQTLEKRKAKLGPDHRDTLISMNYLAGAYLGAGRHQEAIALHEQTLEKRKAKLGPDHRDTLTSMHNLAVASYHAGRLQEAIALDEQMLEKRKAKLGPDHPDTLSSMNNLAMDYLAAGRLQEAIALHEQTFEKLKAKLGPDHPETLNSMNNLAGAYREAGRLQEAIALHEQTLEKRKAKLGPDHPDTLNSMRNLADAYYHAGRHQEAIALHEQTFEKRKAKLGPDHPDTLRSMHNLAGAYQQAGRLEEAIALHEQTLDKHKAKLGPDHPDTLISMNYLVVAYFDAGRLQEAIALGEQTLEKRKAKLGPDHPETLRSMRNLAVAYNDAGKLDEADRLLRDLLERARKKDLPKTIGTHGVLATLGLNLLMQKRYVEAEPVLRECLALREKQLPKDWRRFNALSMLGDALLGQRQYAAAEPLLLEGYEGMKLREAMIPRTGKRRLAEAIDRIVRYYEATGQAEKARTWRQKLPAGK